MLAIKSNEVKDGLSERRRYGVILYLDGRRVTGKRILDY